MFVRSSSLLLLSIQWAVCFLLVTVPLMPYRFFLLPPSVPSFLSLAFRFTPLIISIVIAGLWFASTHIAFLSRIRKIPLGIPILIFFVIGVVSCLGAEKPILSLSKEVYYFFTGSLLYLIVADVFYGRKKIIAPVYCMVLVAYVVAFLGIVEFGIGRNLLYESDFGSGNQVFQQFYPAKGDTRRILSTLGNPIMVGMFLVMMMPLSICLMRHCNKPIIKGGMFLGILMIWFALILTFARGAFFAGLFASLMFLYKCGRVYFVKGLFVFCLAILLFLSLPDTWQIFSGRMEALYAQYITDFASTRRGLAYGFVVEFIDHSPLLGIGAGMYRYARSSQLQQWPLLDTTENMFLEWFVTYGSLGFFCIAFILSGLCRFVLRYTQSPDELNGSLSWAFIASFLGACIVLLTGSVLLFPAIRLVFWILLGLAVAQARSIQDGG